MIILGSIYFLSHTIKNNTNSDHASLNINPKTQLAALEGAGSGLVGWWKFDEGSGTIATDSSGSGNNGTLVNGPMWTTGQVGGALSFDGSDDRIDVSGITSTSGTYTFSLWMKQYFNGSNPILSLFFDSKSGRLQICYSCNNRSMIGYYDGSYHSFSNQPNDNSWHHIVIVLDANTSTGSYYLDGSYVSNSDYTGVDIGGMTMVGSSYYGGFQFKGLIDDFRIYNRALTANEIKQLYDIATLSGEDVSSQITGYSVTASAGPGGSITPSGKITIESGGSQSFYIAPQTGYQVSSVTVDGTPVSLIDNSYSIVNVMSNHSIQATFDVQPNPSQDVVSNLKLVSSDQRWLYWEWTLPQGAIAASVYINGAYSATVSPMQWNGEGGISFSYSGYTATNLQPNTSYNIKVYAKNSDGSISSNYAQNTASTEATPITHSVCGDNLVEAGEMCDGYDLNGRACPLIGSYTGGALSCKTDCSGYVTTSCTVGKIVNAKSCNLSDVTDAVAIANTGDTIKVPAGACVWTSGLKVQKGITLLGAGAGQTVITRSNGRNNDYIISISNNDSSFSRISGFTFIFLGNTERYIYGIVSMLPQFRIDHNEFLDKDNDAICTYTDGFTTGLIDKNSFEDCYYNFRYFGKFYGDSNAYYSDGWERPIKPGSSLATFFEDNSITYSGNADPGAITSGGTYGGRVVWRYNSVSDPNPSISLGEIDAHGNQAPVIGQQNLGHENFEPGYQTSSTNVHRGVVQYEIYNNIVNVAHNLGRYISLRGGTGLIFNNTFTGYNSPSVWMWEEEANRFASWSQTYPRVNFYPAWDQINNVFIWGNTLNGQVTSGSVSQDGSQFFIQKDRDYYDRAPNLSGDIWYGYTPFTYPHPLSQIGISPALINATCSATINTCTSGTFSDTTDTSTQYLWSCLGQNGGTNASCSLNKSITPTPPNPDFNSDGIVNTIDLSLLLSFWNRINALYDLNVDNIVNSLDYSLLLGNWSK